MQRKFLEDLGLAKELIDKILDENSSDIGKAKGDLDSVKTERDTLKTTLTERDKQLEDLKKSAGSNEDLKKQLETLQADNAKIKAENDAKIKAIQIENAVERSLMASGAKNTKAVKALLDLANAELDGENVRGLEAQIKKLQESEDSKFLFNIADDKGPGFKGAKPGEKGDPGAGGGVKNPWSKEHFNLTEQGRLLKENPELAAQLKNTKK